MLMNMLRYNRNQDRRATMNFAADTFATSLLMPRQAVVERFAKRAWELDNSDPTQLFAVAGELDIGYSTLLKHLRYGLDLVSNEWMVSRLKIAPKAIRQKVTGTKEPPRVVILDDHWSNIPIDIEVGDEIAIPSRLHVETGGVIREVASRGEYSRWKGTKTGEANLRINECRCRIRVARTGFCGMLKYRFLDDPDEI